ncbi:hypothetical protein KCU77_g11590, partial [Aureobasidium melanogenum]
MQQLFNSESLRNIHLIENAYSSDPLGGESSIDISSSGSMSCDDLTKLCDTIHSARSAASPSKQNDQLVYLFSRLRCLFSSFSSLAHSFSDNPMDILPGPRTPQSMSCCTRLHHVLKSVHAIGQDASAIVFDSIWEALEPVFESPFDSKHTESRSFQTFPSKSKGTQVPSVVHHAIRALASFVPQASRETWHTVWSATVNGKAYGKQKHSQADNASPSWLSVLDKFEQEPALRMARRLVRAIGARTCLEETLSACDVTDAKPDPRLQIWKTSCRIRESIIDLLVQEEQSIRLAVFKTKYRDDLRHGGELVGTTSIIWLEWLRKCFLKDWDGSLHVNRWSVAGSALELMEDLWKHRGRGQLDMPAKLFACFTVFGALDVDKAAQDWLSYRPDPNVRHLLSFKFLFDTRAMTLLVRTCHHILMRHAYNEVDAVLHLRRRTMPQVNLQDVVYLDRRLRAAQDHYIVLKINRQSVLSDAFDQLWHRERRELLRPLRVRMGIDEGEIGHDLGGVQIEFFKLACQEAFNPAYSLFSIDPQTRLAWFQPATMVPLYKYQLFGLLFALAIYNGITLPVSFPLVFYKKLLFQTLSEADLIEGWPSLARSLQHLQMHQGSVEEDFARDYVYSFDANGLHLDVSMDDPWDGWSIWDKIKTDKHHPAPKSTHAAQIATHKLPLSTDDQTQSRTRAHGYHQSWFEWPGWKVEVANSGELPQPVTNDNRQNFVSSYFKWVIDWSIRPQFNAFAKGFYSVMNLRSLALLNADQFRTLVEGHNHLDIEALQRATTYNHYTATSPVVRWFWEQAVEYP